MSDPQTTDEENAQLLMQCGKEIMKTIKKRKNAAAEKEERQTEEQEANNLINSIS